MKADRYQWIERWLSAWKESVDHLDTTPGGGDVVPAIAMEVAVDMGLELLKEVRVS